MSCLLFSEAVLILFSRFTVVRNSRLKYQFKLCKYHHKLWISVLLLVSFCSLFFHCISLVQFTYSQRGPEVLRWMNKLKQFGLLNWLYTAMFVRVLGPFHVNRALEAESVLDAIALQTLCPLAQFNMHCHMGEAEPWQCWRLTSWMNEAALRFFLREELLHHSCLKVSLRRSQAFRRCFIVFRRMWMCLVCSYECH